MFYVDVIYRQRQPNGVDLPKDKCERTTNGPFTSRESAERYATQVCNQTAVFETVIREEA